MEDVSKNTDLFDARKSFWINANAGSGKTTVLIKRFLALLISGVKPSKIVVIAYTRAAAMELIDRLTRKMIFFSSAKDDDVKNDLLEIFDEVDDSKIKTAKGLFAQTQRDMGHLRIGTIHSFCVDILKEVLDYNGESFPAHVGSEDKMFEMESLVRSKILESLKGGFGGYNDKSGTASSKSADAIETFMRLVGDFDLQQIAREVIRKRSLLGRPDNMAGFVNKFSDALALMEEDPEADIVKKINMGSSNLAPISALICSLESETPKKALSIAEQLREMLKSGLDVDSWSVDSFLEVFLTKELEPRSARGLKGRAQERFIQWSKECLDFISKRNSLLLIKLNLAFFSALEAVIPEAEAFMSANSLIDFDGILWKALSALKDESLQMVVYDFVSGIDHIMVDEAQDVNPVSWEIFGFVVDNFFVCFSQNSPRSFFVVGDEKQSIFRFQGADIDAFFEAREKLRLSSRQFGFPMFCANLEISRRSASDILLAVDDIFNRTEFLGSVSKQQSVKHICSRDDIKGFVGYLSVSAPAKKAQDYNWGFGMQEEEPSSFYVEAATELVTTIIQEGFAPEDIMVIVRNRVGANNSVAELLNNIRNKGVKINMDRMRIGKHILFYDFISICNFINSPWEDLNLAAVLRSVFFQKDLNWIEERALQAREKGVDLFSFICESGDIVSHVLRGVIDLGGREGLPSAFSYLLFKERKIEEVKEQFGDAGIQIVNFILEKLYSAPLFSTITEYAESLFWAGDMHGGLQNGVKVITAHSAKGTESRVVILYDVRKTMSSVNSSNIDKILTFEDIPILIKDLKIMDPRFKGVIEAEKKLSLDEEKRILYVAMTRAKERLYVIGEPSDDSSWFNTIKASRFSSQVFLGREAC